MDSGPTIVLAAVAAAVAVVAVVLLVVLVAARRSRRRTEAALAASRAELEALQQRLDSLVEQLAAPPTERPADRPVERTGGTPAPRHRNDEPEYVITTAGLPDGRASDEVTVGGPPAVDARQFASVALGESLVRLVSLGYGVRRALSAENRNRIAFEMRREVRRSRKDRRRELRDLRRRLREVPEPDERAHPIDPAESAA